jgi:hypothetical protein
MKLSAGEERWQRRRKKIGRQAGAWVLTPAAGISFPLLASPCGNSMEDLVRNMMLEDVEGIV